MVEPHLRDCLCGDCPEQPMNSPLTTKEKNTPNIRPAIRVNKADNASQHLEQSICERCQQENCQCRAVLLKENKPEQPNTELLIVKTIQGLMGVVNNNLEKLHVKHISTKQILVDKALEEIDLFEKTTLFELQKVFE